MKSNPFRFHQRDKIPLVSLLVHTGDHGYNVRLKNNAIPLAQEGVASIIIENPYYGQRKPEGQFRSSLLHVNLSFFDLICLNFDNHFFNKKKGC